METLKEVSEPSLAPASQDKYKVVAPETMLETFMSDSEEEGGEDIYIDRYRYKWVERNDCFYLLYFEFIGIEINLLILFKRIMCVRKIFLMHYL